MKLTNSILGKHIALSGRRTPEGQRRAQEGLIDELRRMREGSPVDSPDEDGEFIVRANADA